VVVNGLLNARPGTKVLPIESNIQPIKP